MCNCNDKCETYWRLKNNDNSAIVKVFPKSTPWLVCWGDTYSLNCVIGGQSSFFRKLKPYILNLSTADKCLCSNGCLHISLDQIEYKQLIIQLLYQNQEVSSLI